MPALTFAASVEIARPPEAVYDLVSDVTRTGEWSPQCRACWWDEGDGPRAGAWFTGRNETPDRVWETRSQVEAADRPRRFAWLVGGSWVRWSYDVAPSETGCVLTESCEFLPAGMERFAERYGDDAPAQIADRAEAATRGIPETLAAVKRVAEAS